MLARMTACGRERWADKAASTSEARCHTAKANATTPAARKTSGKKTCTLTARITPSTTKDNAKRVRCHDRRVRSGCRPGSKSGLAKELAHYERARYHHDHHDEHRDSKAKGQRAFLAHCAFGLLPMHPRHQRQNNGDDQHEY